MSEYSNPEPRNNDKYKAMLAVLVVLALIFALLFFGPRFWPANRSGESSKSDGKEKQATSIPPKIKIKARAPIDYEKSKDLMAQRKAELGFDKSVDMIVRPGETIRIGETLVSIDEILDKIRLKTGEIDEQNLSDPSSGASLSRRIDLPAALEKLRVLEKEYQQLKTAAESASEPVDDATRQRSEDLAEKVSIYRLYEEVLQKLDNAQKQMAGANQDHIDVIKQQIDQLNQEKKKLEQTILTAMQAGGDLNVYGIYIVKSGDNIWNIHFQFLRDYFTHKGVNLSPGADEPGASGQSSGVGRLLKFSESMVYIYNLREKKIDPDLNLIHPLSKIVVFNLARVFAMLESINYNEVDRIRFDGEMLWLPAKSN